MAQKTAEAEAKDQHTQRDHIDDDEVTELQSPASFYEKVREQAERFASTRLGQLVIERVDRGLKLIEDTTKWSLPQDKNSSAVVLERPLPWAPFLLLIILLRLVRIWLSVGALMIGDGPVAPTDMIYFIQTRRHKLRAIRVHGLRVMRNRQQEMSPGKSFTQKLSLWFNRAICRPGVQRENSGRAFNMHSSDQQPANQSVTKRSLEDESNEDDNLTIDEMLAKYANQNSEDDSDFVPSEEKDSGSSSSNTSDGDSDSHTSELMTSSEEQQLVENRDKILAEMSNKENPEKPITVNGSNGSSEQAELVPAAHLRASKVKAEQWKSSPGHLSAALMKTQMYNNITAAGSPNNFNSSLGTQALLKSAAINAAPSATVHSTPNSELDEIHSAGSETEEAARQSIYQADQQDTHPAGKPFKQQQQRQFNHSHQRFRGRNRR
ncbi:uncharacterized protein LOC6559380 isoform X2 [Drosophila grimshawi]|uniref:uncharacterized protein LOC6559380 isoform X2 n=1 Tax=Drosophila grimshawi TaxID=7222 RepID=UPI000C870723|nr:uncharacterized protein LOC6559380 isoform X2 [Drosophila grimshawi]XP_032589981.1 uncharacterized protein LOC6559380 isoform X2 [Drosophila grimshawi]